MTEVPQTEPWVEVTTSRQFPPWLAEMRLSLAFTTYQAGKLFLLNCGEQWRIIDLPEIQLQTGQYSG